MDRATADWPLLSLTDKYALVYLWKNFTPPELGVIYRWVYLLKAALNWFMAAKVKTNLPVEITAT